METKMLPTLEEAISIYQELGVPPVPGTFAYFQEDEESNLVCAGMCLAGALFVHKNKVDPIQVFATPTTIIAAGLKVAHHDIVDLTAGFDGGWRGDEELDGANPIYYKAYELGKGLREEYDATRETIRTDEE